jgi:hypothetical protein
VRPLNQQPFALALPDLAVDSYRIPLRQERRNHLLFRGWLHDTKLQLVSLPIHFLL